MPHVLAFVVARCADIAAFAATSRAYRHALALAPLRVEIVDTRLSPADHPDGGAPWARAARASARAAPGASRLLVSRCNIDGDALATLARGGELRELLVAKCFALRSDYARALLRAPPALARLHTLALADAHELAPALDGLAAAPLPCLANLALTSAGRPCGSRRQRRMDAFGSARARRRLFIGSTRRARASDAQAGATRRRDAAGFRAAGRAAEALVVEATFASPAARGRCATARGSARD